MATAALVVGTPMIKGEAVIKRGITEICRILVAATTRAGEVVGGWCMATIAICCANETVVEVNVVEVGCVNMASGTGSWEMVGR